MPPYRRHGRRYKRPSPDCGAGVTTRTKDKAAERLEHSRQRPVICSQPLVQESEGAEGEIEPVWAPLSADSESQHKSLLTM